MEEAKKLLIRLGQKNIEVVFEVILFDGYDALIELEHQAVKFVPLHIFIWLELKVGIAVWANGEVLHVVVDVSFFAPVTVNC